MKKQSLLLFALLLVISCSKPDVKKEMKIVEQEAAPVVEEPISVGEKAESVIEESLIVEKKVEPVVEEPSIVEKKVEPVIEKPIIVKQKAKPVVQTKNEISQNLKEKWAKRIKKQQIKDKLQQKKKRETKIAEQEIEPAMEKETEIAQANEAGAYKDGKRDGVWTFTDEKGIKEKEVVYNLNRI